MARKVIWTDPAVDDLEAAVEFVARDASALAQQVCDAGDSLAEFSERGRRLPDPELSDFRELLSEVTGSFTESHRGNPRD